MGVELGTKIRQLRKFSGMTQEQLTDHIGGSDPDQRQQPSDESFAVKRHTACDDWYYDGGVCLRAQEYCVEYGLYFVQIYRDRAVCGGAGQLFPASASCSRSGSCRYCVVYILFCKEQEKLRKNRKE